MSSTGNRAGTKNDAAGSAGPWTVLKIIRWTTDYLQQKGVETPRLDAEVLLADLLGLSRVQLYCNYDRPLTPDELAGYRALVKRRAAREPVSLILGRREFYSLDIHIDAGVLTPRPETELLVEETVRLARERASEEEIRIADVGTGTGAVAAALLTELGRAKAFASDLDPAALENARKNIERLGLSDRVVFGQGDLLAPWAGEAEGFDFIVSNPPYIPEAAMADLPPEVALFEPKTALCGGPDGLEVIRRLVAAAGPRLKTGGALLIEIWPDHPEALPDMAAQNGFAPPTILPDLAGRPRAAVFEAEKD